MFIRPLIQFIHISHESIQYSCVPACEALCVPVCEKLCVPVCETLTFDTLNIFPHKQAVHSWK